MIMPRKKPVNLDDESPQAEDPRPHIPQGEYEAICTKTEIGFKWNRDVYFHFTLYGGDYDGTRLFMKCPFPEGKIKRNSKFYLQWCLANGAPPVKGQCLARSIFPKRLYRVKVRDTKRRYSDSNILLPQTLQYSVIDTIIEPLTGRTGHIDLNRYEENKKKLVG